MRVDARVKLTFHIEIYFLYLQRVTAPLNEVLLLRKWDDVEGPGTSDCLLNGGERLLSPTARIALSSALVLQEPSDRTLPGPAEKRREIRQIDLKRERKKRLEMTGEIQNIERVIELTEVYPPQDRISLLCHKFKQCYSFNNEQKKIEISAYSGSYGRDSLDR